jgi:hypothetical protein
MILDDLKIDKFSKILFINMNSFFKFEINFSLINKKKFNSVQLSSIVFLRI